MKGYSLRNSLIIIFLYQINLTIPSHAQTLQWAKNLGGNNSVHGKAAAVDAFGNIYTTGDFQGVSDFDPGPSVYNLISGRNGTQRSQFISKLDPYGNFVWAKYIGDSLATEGLAITLDSLGNVYTAGYFQGQTDFDPSGSVYNLVASSYMNAFVLKLDNGGNFMWAVALNGSGQSKINSLAVETNGNVYITGFFEGIVDFDPSIGMFNLTSAGGSDVFIEKLNINGNLEWVNQFGGVGIENGNSITLDGVGNIYSTGIFHDTIDFDPGISNYYLNSIPGYNNSFILKLNTNGLFIWAISLPVESIAITSELYGSVYITGNFGGVVDFNPGTPVNTLSHLSGSVFILKLDSSGNYSWAKNIAGAGFVYSITRDLHNNIYTTGYFSYTADFDPGTSSYNLTSSGYSDIFISKLFSNGNFAWARKFSDPNDDWTHSITTDNTGYVITTGYFKGMMNFDPPGTYNITASGPWDAFVSKHSQCENSSSMQVIVACDIYLSPSSNYTWTFSGIYNDTITNSSGCDSIITIDLTILPSPIISITAQGNTTFCQGDSVMLSGTPGFTTYQWYRRNYAIPSANSMNYIAKSGGRYKCIAQNVALCADTSNTIIVNVPCIPIGPNHERTEQKNELSFAKIKIYPNPGDGVFTILSPSGKLEIYNSMGVVVYTEEIFNDENILDISKCSDGIYTINLRTDKSVFCKKYILTH